MKDSPKKLIASIGTAFAALCCIGAPFVILGLTAVGLTFILNDYILFPLLFLSLALGFHTLWKLPISPRRNYRIGWYVCAAILLVVSIFMPQYPFLFWIALLCLLCSLWGQSCCCWCFSKKK